MKSVAASRPIPEEVPASPCRGICLMDPATRTCRGCRRTIAEIAGWYAASSAEKRAILAQLAMRGGGEERQ